MLTGKYTPVLIKSLPAEKDVGLFDYLATYYDKPYSNQIINLRPISNQNENKKQRLTKIFDDRDFSDYWNINGTDVKPYYYLDVDLNYHFFIPTHVYYRHYKDRYAVDIEVKCGMSSEEMETILHITNNKKAENTVELKTSKMCRFFRYQMNGPNNINGQNIDLYDFDLYGDLYASVGLIKQTVKVKPKNTIIMFFALLFE